MADVSPDEKPVVGGLAGFVMDMVRRGRSGLGAVRTEKQMKLVETLQLGGKRQVMLVSCGERRFLVGVGAECVQTIVAVDAGEVWM